MPAEADSLVGRVADLVEIKRRLSQTRLLTLTGPGGCGKTRLAFRAAAELEAGFPDGAWVVQLATVADSALVPRAVAAALGVRGIAGAPLLSTLSGAVASRRLLLVLDNCEHLVGACARLAETLLRASPHLRILATSREPLRIAGETSWRVPPLAIPAAQPGTLESLAEVPAVALFVDRARARQSAFALTPANAAAVATICCQLEGLPLALELAAAQMAVLSPEQLAARLDDSLGLLAGGRRTLGRQETLRATLDWSYGLLTEQEKRLLGRLAVFAGGFDLEAAEGVCAGEPIHRDQVLPTLRQLVGKSLVETGGRPAETRYRMLEPIGQYAREQLALRGEHEVLRQRHAEWFADRAEASEPWMFGRQRRAWLALLEADQDNFRAALSWARHTGGSASEIGLRLCGALMWYWAFRGEGSEGLQWLEAALTKLPHGDPRLRAKALYAAAELGWQMGETELARQRAEESARLFRGLGDRRGLAFCLQSLPMTNGHPESRQNREESERLFAEIGDCCGIALAVGAVDMMALFTGHDEDGEHERHLLDSLVLWRELGDRWGAAQMLNILGDLARSRGEDEVAARRYRESLELLREEGLLGSVPSLLQNLGYLALRRRDTRRARRLLRDALRLFRDQGDQRGVADCFDGLAGVLCAIKHPVPAVRLLAAAYALREVIHATIWPANQDDYDRNLRLVRAQLDEASFAAAWRDGRNLSPEQAVSEALQGEADVLEGAASVEDLTPREREVALLVAKGLTNRQIGEALVDHPGDRGTAREARPREAWLQFTCPDCRLGGRPGTGRGSDFRPL